MTKPKTASPSKVASDEGLPPAEVFLVLLRQAVDSAAAVLEEAGMTDEAIWASYRSALNLLNQATVDVETESPIALAA